MSEEGKGSPFGNFFADMFKGEKPPIVLDSEEDDPPNSGLKTTIAVIEDQIELHKKDKNSIYIRLQEDMADHPELAEFVANKMKVSLTLEEANLIGETALVVYKVMKSLNPSDQE